MRWLKWLCSRPATVFQTVGFCSLGEGCTALFPFISLKRSAYPDIRPPPPSFTLQPARHVHCRFCQVLPGSARFCLARPAAPDDGAEPSGAVRYSERGPSVWLCIPSYSKRALPHSPAPGPATLPQLQHTPARTHARPEGERRTIPPPSPNRMCSTYLALYSPVTGSALCPSCAPTRTHARDTHTFALLCTCTPSCSRDTRHAAQTRQSDSDTIILVAVAVKDRLSTRARKHTCVLSPRAPSTSFTVRLPALSCSALPWEGRGLLEGRT